MVRCHVAKTREVLCVRCVFVQPDALAHSGAHSSSDALTHTGTDGDALHGDALHSGPKHGNAEYGARELRQFRHVRHE
jgi:hypothetical protein